MKHSIFYYVIGLAYAISLNASPILLTEMDGTLVPFTNLRGKLVMINYWASWCRSCIDEIHELNSFYRKNLKKVALYAVNYDGVPVAKQNQLIKKYHISYPSLRIDPSILLHLEDLSAVPVTFVFNPNGQLINTLYGGQTEITLKQLIK